MMCAQALLNCAVWGFLCLVCVVLFYWFVVVVVVVVVVVRLIFCLFVGCFFVFVFCLFVGFVVWGCVWVCLFACLFFSQH